MSLKQEKEREDKEAAQRDSDGFMSSFISTKEKGFRTTESSVHCCCSIVVHCVLTALNHL